MSRFMALAGAAAVVAVAIGAFVINGNRSPGGIGGPAISSPTSAPSMTPSGAPDSPPPTPLPSIDTTGWTTYESSRYEFAIGHPPGWEEIPASRDWSHETDTNDWLSPGMEAFFTPDGEGVRVSAWGVPLDPGFTNDPTWTDVEAWIEEFCQRTDGASCPGIHDRAVRLCLEARDCHPGLLVPFESEVKAFYADTDQMVVVVVWWGENESAVVPFGGSRRLLEAFLSTMNVWPADGDRGLP